MQPAPPDSGHPENSPPRADPLLELKPIENDVEAARARRSIEARIFGAKVAPLTIGRYRVVDRIGAGGMGVVYRAHDPELARDVALKLLEHARPGSTAAARLQREARVLAQLTHPNVVHVYDVGADDRGAFVAMELVEGTNLATFARPGVRWDLLLRALVEAGRGLAAAHERGVIHRDFKPENVLVGHDHRVKVADFGLAGESDTWTYPADEKGHGDSLPSGPLTSLTRTGALVGTPMYLAPELYAGEAATTASDLFSFCVTAYVLLYGRAPFDGEDVSTYRANMLAGRLLPPPKPTAERAVPKAVFAALAQGLRIDPRERPQLPDLLDQLDRVLRPRAWRRIGASAFAGATAMGALTWALTGPLLREEPDEPHGSYALAEDPTGVASPVPPGTSSAPDAPDDLVPRATFSAVLPRPGTDGFMPTDTTSEPSERPQARVLGRQAQEPRADAPVDRNRAQTAGRADYCYFDSDTLKLLRRTSTRASTGRLRTEDRCWECTGTAPRDRVDPQCTHNIRCFPALECP